MEYKIIDFTPEDAEQAYHLIKTVYDGFLYNEANEAGRAFFYDYINAENILKRYWEKISFFLCAKDNKQNLLGIMEIRNYNHISLLFVHKKHHKKGLSRLLYQEAVKKIIDAGNKSERNPLVITVNSSIYAAKIYEKLGFVALKETQYVEGMRFIPMEHRVSL